MTTPIQDALARTAPPTMQLRHVGMYVRDIDVMAAFYREVLGFVETDRGETRGQRVVFLTRDADSHHQLVMETGRPPGEGPGHGMQQLSFKVQALDDLRAMYRVIWDRRDVSRIAPVDHGNAWSLYFHDPEMNRIEIYLDTPWHIAQPHREELDLSLSDAKILALTEQRARRDAGFQPMAQYRAALAERIAATRRLAAGTDTGKTS